MLKFFAAFMLVLVGCAQEKSTMLAHKRDRGFYADVVNPATEFPQAEQKLDSLKILETGDAYPIRLALFDNGRFYYQVDKLGNGHGDWLFQEGALVLKAHRMVFDVEFWVSAAGLSGDEKLVRFMDRHGMNSHAVVLRDPSKQKAPPALRTFVPSEKDI